MQLSLIFSIGRRTFYECMPTNYWVHGHVEFEREQTAQLWGLSQTVAELLLLNYKHHYIIVPRIYYDFK